MLLENLETPLIKKKKIKKIIGSTVGKTDV